MIVKQEVEPRNNYRTRNNKSDTCIKIFLLQGLKQTRKINTEWVYQKQELAKGFLMLPTSTWLLEHRSLPPKQQVVSGEWASNRHLCSPHTPERIIFCKVLHQQIILITPILSVSGILTERIGKNLSLRSEAVIKDTAGRVILVLKMSTRVRLMQFFWSSESLLEYRVHPLA